MTPQTPKQFYKTYQADDTLSELSETLCTLIHKENPVHAFEFGCGTGKHLRRLRNKEIATFGLDISILNCLKAQMDMDGIVYGDETYLRHLVNFDVVFTVSVLDHIEEIGGIVQELKRIANKAVFLAETIDPIGEFYFTHDYSRYGFEILPYGWVSDGDGATYHIYKWNKKNGRKDMDVNDDLG